MPESDDYYIDDETGLLVFTKQYHINRGYCCGKKCRHCPFVPKYQSGNTSLADQIGTSNKKV